MIRDTIAFILLNLIKAYEYLLFIGFFTHNKNLSSNNKMKGFFVSDYSSLNNKAAISSFECRKSPKEYSSKTAK